MKMYSLEAVEKYLSQLNSPDLYTLPGTLLDSYIIYHGFAIEIIEAIYINSWSSAYTRHIYRKRIPKRIFGWINWLISEADSPEEEEYYINIMELLSDFDEKEAA